jgi:predicted GNAT family acetyltransferase
LLEFLDRDRVSIGVGLMTTGRLMVLSHVPFEGGEALADFCQKNDINPPGLQGPPSVVDAFATRWKSLTGRDSRVGVRMAIHQLNDVRPPRRPAAGAMRAATSADVDLLAGWITDFGSEICESHILENARSIAQQRIAEGALRIWEVDHRPVAMAGATGATKHGIRINLVFTPRESRNRGYATALVSTLSQQQLDAGRRFCFLYTDLTNPTSNKIYRSIGYELIAESMRRDFDAPH